MNLETTTAVYAGNVRLSYGMIIAQSHISFIMDAHGFPCVSGARRCIAEYQKLHGIKDDASFLRSNGFVSLMQIVAAVFLLSAMITCLVLSLRKRRLHRFHLFLTFLFLIGIGLVGYMEYDCY